MPDRFSVDFAWLDTLMAAFDGSTVATDAALEALHETGPIRTGHKDLDTACDHFKGKWEDRAEEFRKDIGKFRASVDRSKAAYGATEEQVSASMTRLTTGVPAATRPVPPAVVAVPSSAAESPLRSILDPDGSSASPSAPLPTSEPSRIGEVFR
ncbi:hypothetical protein ACWGR4_11540 [Embleya sp. NPDC055664]